MAIEGLHKKLCAPRVARVPAVGIPGFTLGNLGTKSHLDVAPVESCKVYYKGEGGGFPQVQAMVSLVSPNCWWLVLAPKVLQLCTNQFVLVLCPIPELQHALLPLYSGGSQGTCPNSLLFHCFQIGLTFESLKKLGVRHLLGIMYILRWLYAIRCLGF
jgi:hypothetical protein